jgi:hypothetical protein
MATNGSAAVGFAPVLTAMATMRDGQREQKKAAHHFLETFQKSVRQGEERAQLSGIVRLIIYCRQKHGRLPSGSSNPMQTQKLSYSQLRR